MTLKLDSILLKGDYLEPAKAQAEQGYEICKTWFETIEKLQGDRRLG